MWRDRTPRRYYRNLKDLFRSESSLYCTLMTAGRGGEGVLRLMAEGLLNWSPVSVVLLVTDSSSNYFKSPKRTRNESGPHRWWKIKSEQDGTAISQVAHSSWMPNWSGTLRLFLAGAEWGGISSPYQKVSAPACFSGVPLVEFNQITAVSFVCLMRKVPPLAGCVFIALTHYFGSFVVVIRFHCGRRSL